MQNKPVTAKIAKAARNSQRLSPDFFEDGIFFAFFAAVLREPCG